MPPPKKETADRRAAARFSPYTTGPPSSEEKQQAKTVSDIIKVYTATPHGTAPPISELFVDKSAPPDIDNIAPFGHPEQRGSPSGSTAKGGSPSGSTAKSGSPSGSNAKGGSSSRSSAKSGSPSGSTARDRSFSSSDSSDLFDPGLNIVQSTPEITPSTSKVTNLEQCAEWVFNTPILDAKLPPIQTRSPSLSPLSPVRMGQLFADEEGSPSDTSSEEPSPGRPAIPKDTKGPWIEYIQQGIIGSGNFGTVYQITERSTQNMRALKEVKDCRKGSLNQKNVEREITILQTFQHDNVVSITDVFRDKESIVYMAFEYCVCDLRGLMNKDRIYKENTDENVISVAKVRQIIYDILTGLTFLHENRIIHRDMKPDNVLITAEGQIKIADFGCSRKVPQIAETYRAGVKTKTRKRACRLSKFDGSCCYMAPELLLKSRYYLYEVDVWAVGCIAGEMFKREPLFPGINYDSVLLCIRELCGEIPEWESNHQFDFERNVMETFEEALDGDYPDACEFMDQILKVNPCYRDPAHEFLEHDLFDSRRNGKMEPVNKTDLAKLATESKKKSAP